MNAVLLLEGLGATLYHQNIVSLLELREKLEGFSSRLLS